MISKPHCETKSDSLGQLNGFKAMYNLKNSKNSLFLKIGKKKKPLKHERCNLGSKNISIDVLNIEMGHQNGY